MKWQDFKNKIITQYENGKLKPVTISYENINFEHVMINLDNVDVSQNTGTVIIRTFYDVNDKILCQYADF